MRLPVGADMVFARADCEREIRIVMIGADPCAVERDLRGDTGSDAVNRPDVLDHINQRLTGFRLPDGLLGVIVLYVEVHVFGTTGSLSGGNCGGILGKGGNREKN